MYRESFHTPPLSKTNKWIIISVVSLFFLTALLKQFGSVSLDHWLGLSVAGLEKGLIFQIITFPLVQYGLLGTVFNCLILWFIGSDLEFRWGSSFYRRYLLFVTLASGIFYITINYLFLEPSFWKFYPLVGLSGINYALLVSYAIIFPDRPLMLFFLFSVKAKYFCLILGGIELYTAMFSSTGKSAWAHLMAMACGWLMLVFLSKKSQGFSFVDFFSLKNWRNKKALKRRKSFYMVKTEDETEEKNDQPKYWH